MPEYSASSKKYNIDHIVQNVVGLMAVEKDKRDYQKIIENMIKMKEPSDFILFNLSLILNRHNVDFNELCREIAPHLSDEQKEAFGKVFSNFTTIIE